MKITKGKLSDIEKIDELIDSSWNGTCFSYSWYLKFKDSEEILKIYDDKEKLLGFMPLFKTISKKKIFQSTIYIPYGGPVIFNVPSETRHHIRFIRDVEKSLIKYIQENYDEATFSLDIEIEDIMPFIRAGFTPECRYTYRLDLIEGIDKIFSKFGHDRKKDIRKGIGRGMKFFVDTNNEIFDTNICMKWERNYGKKTTAKQVHRYIKETIEHNRGMCFMALNTDGSIAGGVHLAWDNKCAYILYSYYSYENDDVAISFIYYNMINYLISNTNVKYLDFEGSVFECIEDFNISFGAYQCRFYNMHWNKKNKPYFNIYDYGEKNYE